MFRCSCCKKSVVPKDQMRIMGYALHKECAFTIGANLRRIDAHYKKREIELAKLVSR
jgi:hypothetical protein